MAYTSGTANIKLRNLYNVTIAATSTVVLDGCNIENGASLTMSDGETFKAACGQTQELSEKAAIMFNYIPTSASDGNDLSALDGDTGGITLAFTDKSELLISNSIISVNKKVVAGQLTKYEVSIDATRANIDEILTYSA